MDKKDLRSFNPNKVAALEASVWNAYYSHRFLKLSFILIRSLRELYNLGLLSSLHAGYHVADATIDFRLHKNKEDRKQIGRKLTSFFRILSSHSLAPFDYKKAADLELQWWFVDRYPGRYNISREEAIAISAGTIYGIDPSRLMQYANYRARAMVIQDIAETEHKEADWEEIKSLLQKAYQSLHENIRQ